MRTERGLDRITAFTDGVVAIALTLLVLPLVDLEVPEDGTLIDLVVDNRGALIAFAVSFFVIAQFWWGHHQIFERIGRYDAALVQINILWLFTIVWLPFPTNFIGSASGSRPSVALYIGSLLAVSVLLAFMSEYVIRHPDLQAVPLTPADVTAERAGTIAGVAVFALGFGWGMAVPDWFWVPLALYGVLSRALETVLTRAMMPKEAGA